MSVVSNKDILYHTKIVFSSAFLDFSQIFVLFVFFVQFIIIIQRGLSTFIAGKRKNKSNKKLDKKRTAIEKLFFFWRRYFCYLWGVAKTI